MDIDELKETVFSIIEENDPFKAGKQLQLKYWCRAFLQLFDCRGERELSFFLDVLSDKECWKESNTIHNIKLNRRIAAKKMTQSHSWKGTVNPLDKVERYQLACWCCLEDDIVTLYQYFEEKVEIITSDINIVERSEKFINLSLKCRTDSMIEYWSHVMNKNVSELNLGGMHLFAYALDCVLGKMYFKHVEAVEFFWHKIKEVPENELNNQQKDEIFMKTVVHASASTCGSHPEIFEFCFSQLNPEQYPELLRRDFQANRYYASFIRLKNALRFDLFQNLFDCLKPSYLERNQYQQWLRLLKIKKYQGSYECAAVELFRYMWMKQEFRDHRSFALKEELTAFYCQGELLVPLIQKNHMDLVWAMLDAAKPVDFEIFKSSEAMKEICLVLKNRDPTSLSKFINYHTNSP